MNGVLEASLFELDQDAFDTRRLSRGRPDVAKRGHSGHTDVVLPLKQTGRLRDYATAVTTY